MATNDDLELERFLAHKSDLQEAYASLEDDSPSASTDAAILAAAANAVHLETTKRASGPFGSHWTVPTSLAAVVVLSVSVVFLVERESVLTYEPAAPHSESAPPASQPAGFASPGTVMPPTSNTKAFDQNPAPIRSTPSPPTTRVGPSSRLEEPDKSKKRLPGKPSAGGTMVTPARAPAEFKESRHRHLEPEAVREIRRLLGKRHAGPLSTETPAAESQPRAGTRADVSEKSNLNRTARPSNPVSRPKGIAIGPASTETDTDPTVLQELIDNTRTALANGRMDVAIHWLNELRERFPNQELPPDLAEFARKAR